jgi:hypothetical protein
MNITINKGFISIKWKTKKEKKLRSIFKKYCINGKIKSGDIVRIAEDYKLWIAANPYDKLHDIDYLISVSTFKN